LSSTTPICTLLVSALATLAAWVSLAPSASARPLATGIIPTDVESVASPLAMERIRSAGNTYVKVNAFWPAIAPGADSPTRPSGLIAADPSSPMYDWSSLDPAVKNATAAGLTPLLLVTNSPRWAREPGCTDQTICYPSPQEYADFTTAVAKRYSGTFDPGTGTLPRVRYWQAWGEANLFLFFMPQFENGEKVSPDNYRSLLNPFAAAVKSVDPTNQVVAAGLAPLKRPGGLGPLDFTRRLLCMQGRMHPKPQPGCDATARFDIAATHPYTSGGPTHEAPGPDDVMLGNLPKMTKLLRAAKRAGKIQSDGATVPFWVTEFSWDSNPPDHGGLKMRLFARWMDEAFYRMWKSDVSNVFWFGLRDQDPANGWGDTAQSGLYFRGPTIAEDKPKTRAIRAFQFPFVALKSGRRILVWGRTPDSGPGKIRIERNSGRGFHKLAIMRANGEGIFKKKLHSTALTGSLRAKELAGGFAGAISVPFSLHYVRDQYLPPFGSHGQTPGTGVGRLVGPPFG
jgi:hypothetical protein